MFGPPADTPWLWVGLTLGSAVMLSVVLGVPTAAPQADRVATTIDEVAVSDGGQAEIELRAEAVRIGQESIGLRGPGGRSHASFKYGPVTPVVQGTKLAAVLAGQPPETVFETPGEFKRALYWADRRRPDWQPAGATVRVKQVHYEEVNGVLVGT